MSTADVQKTLLVHVIFWPTDQYQTIKKMLNHIFRKIYILHLFHCLIPNGLLADILHGSKVVFYILYFRPILEEDRPIY